jgi:5'(3')-deoxyribonucleotidase
MIKTFSKYKTEKFILGVDVDGVLNNFTDAFFIVYKKYFPNKKISPIVDDWFFYKNFDYDGRDPNDWFLEKKAETFEYSKPYPGAIENLSKLYDYVKSLGGSLYIVTNQPTPESKIKGEEWLKKYDAKYDKLIFAPEKEKFNHCDILVDDSEHVLKYKPENKIGIKINHLYNKNVKSNFNVNMFYQISTSLISKAIKLLKKA